MVKKFILQLSGSYAPDNYVQVLSPVHGAKDKCMFGTLNDTIHNQLIHNKNNITNYHKTRKWDRYKKLTNEYELVFTSTQGFPSIASYNPISRSYFKLWEILCDFRKEFKFSALPMKTIFLADAPGGFGEAFINFRRKYRQATDDNEPDTLFGMSLRATNKIIPNWKFNEEYCKRNNLNLFYGRQGTGSLYDIENIEDLLLASGTHSAHFITADGGFDFSGDFNNQEEMSLRLILCEIYAALLLQAEGGSFVLKIYDIHSSCTIKLLYALKCFYQNMFLIKPLSSRPANSEKYVVCTEYAANHTLKHHRILNILKSNIQYFRPNLVLKDLDVPCTFIFDILHYNRVYITNQSLHIIKTLALIDEMSDNEEKEMIRQQVRKALKWCYKYQIDVSMTSLKQYKAYFPKAESTSTTGLT